MKNAKIEILNFNPKQLKRNQQLKTFLYENLYTNYKVNRMNHKALRIIKELFETYTSNPRLLSPSTRKKIKQYSIYQVVCDYIAGMTDRYAFGEHNKLCDLGNKI